MHGRADGQATPRPTLTTWAPPPEASAREALARRGAFPILGEALVIYRRRLRPLLMLSLLTEGIVTLIALPYTITAGNQTLDLLRAASGAAADPATAPAALPRLLTDPALAALGGALSVVPLAGTLVLMAAITALLLAPQPEAHTWRGALARALEHRAAILGPVIALAIFAALIQLPIAGAASQAQSVPAGQPRVSGTMVAVAIMLAAMAPALIIAALYLAVRWAVAVPVLVMEVVSLRRSLARSVMLTRRRTLRVGLAMLLAFGLTGIVGGIATTVTLMSFADQLAAGSGLVAIVPIAIYVLVRVVLAPIGTIVPVLLYRDLRLASDGGVSTGWSTNAGPEPRRSDGVP